MTAMLQPRYAAKVHEHARPAAKGPEVKRLAALAFAGFFAGVLLRLRQARAAAPA